MVSLSVLLLMTGIAMAAPIPGGTFVGTVNLDGSPAPAGFFVNCTNGQNASVFEDGTYQLSITINDGDSTTGNITACIPGIGALTYTGVNLMVDNYTMNFNFTTPPAIISLSSATYTVDEDIGVGYLTVTIVRSGNTTSTVYANISTTNGTAVSGGASGNYTAASAQYVFTSGQTERYAAITITNNTYYNATNKYFFVNLTTTNATFGTPRNATVTILEDEEPPLLANFTSEKTYSYGYRLINFTDASTGNILGRNWSFGDDGGNVTTVNSYRLFVEPGNYTVILTVTNGTANSTHSENITIIKAPPTASFITNVSSGAPPLCVAFTNFSYGNVTTYAWNFDDGTANATTASPTHTFNDSGTYLVVLSVSNATMSSSATLTITVATPLLADGSFTVGLADWSTVILGLIVVAMIALVMFVILRIFMSGESDTSIILPLVVIAITVIAVIMIGTKILSGVTGL